MQKRRRSGMERSYCDWASRVCNNTRSRRWGNECRSLKKVVGLLDFGIN
jgi:hypothetical protein